MSAKAGRIIGCVVAYLAVAWLTIGVLADGIIPHARWYVLAAALYTIVPIVVLIASRGWPFYPRAAFRVLVIRGVLYGQILLPFVAAAGLVGLVAGAPWGASLAAGRLLALAMLVGLVLVFVAGYAGSRRLMVREVTAYLDTLPAAFDGFRIAQISDMHVGPQTSRAFLRRVAATAHGLTPDLIAVTGDLVDDRAEDVAAYAAGLGSLAAPAGVMIIAGNHDVYAGWAAVERSLAGAVNGTILVNQAALLRRGSDALAIVGTGDPAGQSGWSVDAHVAPDLDRAFATVPRGVTTIALAHNPALWPGAARRGAALTLSGHTHWGQFALPRRGWSLASPFLEYAMGGIEREGASLYISPGTGYWGIPFRIGALPEVTLIVLRRGTAHLDVGAARRA